LLSVINTVNNIFESVIEKTNLPPENNRHCLAEARDREDLTEDSGGRREVKDKEYRGYLDIRERRKEETFEIEKAEKQNSEIAKIAIYGCRRFEKNKNCLSGTVTWPPKRR
jgi:hypothetical protein